MSLPGTTDKALKKKYFNAIPAKKGMHIDEYDDEND